MMVGIYEALQDLSLVIPSNIPIGMTHRSPVMGDRGGQGRKSEFLGRGSN